MGGKLRGLEIVRYLRGADCLKGRVTLKTSTFGMQKLEKPMKGNRRNNQIEK
jgi:hypothetical protein